LSLPLAGQVWYVQNDLPAAGDGTSDAPFNTLAAAESASGTGDTVYVFDGDNTAVDLATGYVMETNERLIGEHNGVSLAGHVLHAGIAGALPTLAATNEDVVALAGGATLDGFNLDPAGTGGGISGGTGTVTINDVNVTDGGTAGTQPGVELDGTGTATISDLTVSTNGATGVRLNNGAATFAPTSTITITTANARGLDATGTNLGTSTFDSITVTGSGNGGVSLSGTSGTTTFAGLFLTTTSGTAPAFSLAGAGTVSVPDAGTANVSATGGPAVNVTGTPGAQLAFDTVSSTNSAGDGINLAGLDGGTFTATGGTIAGASGIAFDLEGGSGAITYPGALNDGTGQTADITARSGGAVTLSGAMADGADGGGGISLSGNTGGSTTFGNASKVLNTTTSDAVSFTSSDGHTLNLTGGGLDVDTTGGQGIFASNSGTINVAGAGNTVTSTTGRAVNVQNTDFGGSGFTFQSVSSNGAPNGILLSNTGTSAGMTITGTGAANSGGSIQNATQHGVSLTTTTNFNADELSITGANFAGVDGTDVTNFTFTDGEIVGAGDSLINELHAAFAFNDLGANNVDGQMTITGNTVTNPYAGGVIVRNASGTLSQANVSTNTFQSTTDPATSKQDGVSLHIEGTPTTAARLTEAAISSNSIVNFPSGNGVELVGEQTTSTTGPRASFGVPDSTTNRIVVSNNEIRGNAITKMGVFGVAASVTGMADGNVRIANNGTAAVPMQNILGEGIGVGASGTANADFIVEDNFVSPGNVLGNVGISANANRRVVGATTVATPDVNATIQDNVVSNTSGAGIKVLHFNSNGNLRAKVDNNTVGAPVQPNPGIANENGSSNDPAFNPTLCVQISGNPATGSGPDGFGNTFPGIDLIERGGSNTTYRLQLHGLTPTTATAAQTETFLASQNPASSLGGGFYAGKRASVSEGNQFEACTITF
ncbi:MAG: hypothetical protein M3144_09655, partial [Actinomycetota bacterium]|nr:hypothetical protein [Actinomycetota bacterium]